MNELEGVYVVELKWCCLIVQEKMKRAAVGPLPGVTQDIAGFKVWLTDINVKYRIKLRYYVI